MTNACTPVLARRGLLLTCALVAATPHAAAQSTPLDGRRFDGVFISAARPRATPIR